MPRKKPLPPLALLREGMLEQVMPPQAFNAEAPPDLDQKPLPMRVQQLIEYLATTKTKTSEEMYCFIMYDIEDNKVRRLVAKYLEKKGCMRVQKSVFFAKLHRNLYRDLTQTLKEIQQAYQNNDSIIALPVGEDMLNSLLVIGKEFEYEFTQHQKHTLFF